MNILPIASICFALLAFEVRAEPVCIKTVTDTDYAKTDVDAGKLVGRTMSYFVDSAVLESLPAVDVRSSGEVLLPTKAIGIAFAGYYSKQGFTADDFFARASATFEKADDFSTARTMAGLRRQSEAVRGTWYYVVSVRKTSFEYRRETPTPPVVVLLNGNLIEPEIRTREINTRR